jgi:RimJ/RimL family protein N-acetyltransferase
MEYSFLKETDLEEYSALMFEFSNYKKDITVEYFKEYIQRPDIKILVVRLNNKIIGAGTIFKLEKMHNNPVGQIEDVIITENYRGIGLGKEIVNALVKIGLNDFKCYKVILNCLDKNIKFYEKCGFNISGSQMRC